MIKEIKNLKNIEPLLKKYFPAYKLGDVYEHIAVYSEEEIMAIISYSVIYDRIEINYIVTFPDFRNHGLAEKLLDYVTLKAINLNCNNISLEVDVNNIPAISLYLKNGFKKVTIRKNYYKENDAYLMIKELVVI